MPEPVLRILGVYKPYIPDETYREQWQMTESDEETREHFEGLVLIEAVVDGIESDLQLIEMGQTFRSGDYETFMCAYDEALLSPDGDTLIERGMDCVPGTGTLRFAFYLHCFDPSQPLSWSYGKVECPPVQPAPERLMALVPYNATD